jgi:Glycosyl hydrolases family 25
MDPVILDLSSNNHSDGRPINWDAVKEWGLCLGVIVKATEGTGYTNPWWRSRPGLEGDVDGARRVGLPVIGYHYALFGNATAEAAYFLSVAGDLAACLDGETDTNQPWWDAFLAALNKPAAEELAYGSGSTLPRGIRVPLWPAAYPQDPNLPGEVMHQYTSTLTVPGIVGGVDASHWKGTQDQFNALFRISAQPPPAAAPTATKEDPLMLAYGYKLATVKQADGTQVLEQPLRIVQYDLVELNNVAKDANGNPCGDAWHKWREPGQPWNPANAEPLNLGKFGAAAKLSSILLLHDDLDGVHLAASNEGQVGGLIVWAEVAGGGGDNYYAQASQIDPDAPPWGYAHI